MLTASSADLRLTRRSLFRGACAGISLGVLPAPLGLFEAKAAVPWLAVVQFVVSCISAMQQRPSPESLIGAQGLMLIQISEQMNAIAQNIVVVQQLLLALGEKLDAAPLQTVTLGLQNMMQRKLGSYTEAVDAYQASIKHRDRKGVQKQYQRMFEDAFKEFKELRNGFFALKSPDFIPHVSHLARVEYEAGVLANMYVDTPDLLDVGLRKTREWLTGIEKTIAAQMIKNRQALDALVQENFPNKNYVLSAEADCRYSFAMGGECPPPSKRGYHVPSFTVDAQIGKYAQRAVLLNKETFDSFKRPTSLPPSQLFRTYTDLLERKILAASDFFPSEVEIVREAKGADPASGCYYWGNPFPRNGSDFLVRGTRIESIQACAADPINPEEHRTLWTQERDASGPLPKESAKYGALKQQVENRSARILLLFALSKAANEAVGFIDASRAHVKKDIEAQTLKAR